MFICTLQLYVQFCRFHFSALKWLCAVTLLGVLTARACVCVFPALFLPQSRHFGVLIDSNSQKYSLVCREMLHVAVLSATNDGMTMARMFRLAAFVWGCLCDSNLRSGLTVCNAMVMAFRLPAYCLPSLVRVCIAFGRRQVSCMQLLNTLVNLKDPMGLSCIVAAHNVCCFYYVFGLLTCVHTYKATNVYLLFIYSCISCNNVGNFSECVLPSCWGVLLALVWPPLICFICIPTYIHVYYLFAVFCPIMKCKMSAAVAISALAAPSGRRIGGRRLFNF